MNDVMRIKLVIISLWILFTDDCHAKGYCSFPSFIWDPSPDGSNRKWLWRTEYFRNSDTWETQNEMTAMETEILVQHKVNIPCGKGAQDIEYPLPCFRYDVVYHMICVTEEVDGKYRIQQLYNDGRSSFSCLQFRRVSPDVLIVHKAETKDLNEDRLCYDEALQRDPWPWIATIQTQWSPCPLNGGFDFNGKFGHTSQMLCPLDWRPSRLESECVKGEGITFFFPNKQCNPFTYTRYEQTFQCWASWVEAGFTFILIGEQQREPRYILRLPENANTYDEFVGNLYTSPIVSLNTTGTPPGLDGVMHIQLQLLRSEPGICYDESPLCPQYAEQGKCTNDALHHYGTYCKRSCGLCTVYAPSERAECKYPEELRGDWVMFDDVNREEVVIGDEIVRFSTLGSYICKSKHWENDFYKTISVFTNGCRPRYSCLFLAREEDDLLQFKLSRSHPADKSFELCNFADDPLPLGGKIRSRKTKILLPISSMFYGSCGIGGLVRADVSLSPNRACTGRMWDVDLNTCDTKSVLSLALPQCHIHREFLCTAFTRRPNGKGLLVLKEDTDGKHTYYCWTLNEAAQQKSEVSSLQLERIRCDTSEKLVFSERGQGLLSIFIHRDVYDDKCGKYSQEASDDHAAAHVGADIGIEVEPTSRLHTKNTPSYNGGRFGDSHPSTDRDRNEQTLHLINSPMSKNLESAIAQEPDSGAGSTNGDSRSSHIPRHTDKEDMMHPYTSAATCRTKNSHTYTAFFITIFIYMIT